ncbi:MAG TPA: PHP domain-containing protein, partial [Syntrophobacteria bacterium]|nr:PHP domain-containing protein [Syntrophobacteria bacterium]
MIDLHTHSLFSDGELVVSELVRRAEAAGYRFI